MDGIYRARQSAEPHGPWRVLLALLCVLLVAVAGTVQVAHSHPAGDVAHADCSLCATAHAAVQVAETPAPAPAIAVVAPIEAAAEPAASSALCTFALFTRPPPAV
jgi:hypothetical protein